LAIVRAMKDPARWSNKWMLQTMHIMSTTAKGGIGVVRGQFGRWRSRSAHHVRDAGMWREMNWRPRSTLRKIDL